MTREELQAALTELQSSLTFEEGGEWLNTNAPAENFHELALKLRYTSGLDFDYLFC